MDKHHFPLIHHTSRPCEDSLMIRSVITDIKLSNSWFLINRELHSLQHGWIRWEDSDHNDIITTVWAETSHAEAL